MTRMTSRRLTVLSTLLSLLVCALFSSCEQESLEEEAERLEQEEEEHIHLVEDWKLLEEGEVRYPDTSQTEELLETRLDKVVFQDSLRTLYESMDLYEKNLPYKAFRYAMIGYYHLRQQDKLNKKRLISIIDFTQSSCDKRFYVIDLKQKKLLFNTLVAHGRATGANWAKVFSNRPGSYASSLGFYVTAETYTGSKGYSLRLEGQEEGINENMRERAVVMHDAEYVSDKWVKKYGRIGRSLGCPALPKKVSDTVINVIKGGTPIFAYFEDTEYLNSSRFLDLDDLLAKLEANQERHEETPEGEPEEGVEVQ